MCLVEYFFLVINFLQVPTTTTTTWQIAHILIRELSVWRNVIDKFTNLLFHSIWWKMFQRVFKIKLIKTVFFGLNLYSACAGHSMVSCVVPNCSYVLPNPSFSVSFKLFSWNFLQRRLTVLKLSIKLRHPCFFQVYCNRKPRIRRAVDSDPQYQVQMYFRLIK